MLRGLFTPLHLLCVCVGGAFGVLCFVFPGVKHYWEGCLVSFTRCGSMAASEQREKLRVNMCRGTICLPGHWPVSLLSSSVSIIMFSLVPPSSASLLSDHPFITHHISAFLGLQLPETIPYKTSVSICSSTASCE